MKIMKIKHCEKCNKDVYAELVRTIAVNGNSFVYWQCMDHKGSITKIINYIQHQKIKDANIDINSLPVIHNYSELEICAVCGKTCTENHHWAPRYLFGDECNDWPQAYLCKECHKRWHDLVTPGMCEK